MIRARDDLAKDRQFICWISPQLTFLVISYNCILKLWFYTMHRLNNHCHKITHKCEMFEDTSLLTWYGSKQYPLLPLNTSWWLFQKFTRYAKASTSSRLKFLPSAVISLVIQPLLNICVCVCAWDYWRQELWKHLYCYIYIPPKKAAQRLFFLFKTHLRAREGGQNMSRAKDQTNLFLPLHPPPLRSLWLYAALHSPSTP